MQLPSKGKGKSRSGRVTMVALVLGITITVSTTAHAADHFVRELDAYCITADGTRSGVAASQDGATNVYILRPGKDLQITRSVHNRRTVSEWHRMLDQADFNAIPTSQAPTPYCAIERTEQGQTHTLRWPEGAPPERIADVFEAMLSTASQASTP